MICFFRSDEGATHLLELSKLAEKDPEFYKYLQENDRELLDFDPGNVRDNQSDDEDDEEDGGFEISGDDGRGDDMQVDEDQLPVLTKDILKGWQRAILEVSCYGFLFPIDPAVLIVFDYTIATVPESLPETSNRLPFSCAHE